MLVHGKRLATRQSAMTFLALGLILGAILPAWADAPPPLEPAHFLPGDHAALPAAGDQTQPFVAEGGGGFLAVWADTRSGLAEPDGSGGTGSDIYAARLDADGELIDPTPIRITGAPADQFDPRALWNGESWLVLWSSTQPYGPYFTHFIEGVRLSGSGEVLDNAPMELWSEGGIADDFKGGASNGQDWALVFQQTYVSGLSTKQRLVGRRVTSAGALLDAPHYLYSPSCCSFFWHTGVAYADGVYMVVFEGYFDSWDYGIFGLRLNEGLQTLDSYPLELVKTQWSNDLYYSNPNVASNGSEFYVSWQHWDYGNDSSQVLGARVDSGGNSLDGDGVILSGTFPHKFDDLPAIAWDGGQWIVGWPESDWMLARVATGGGVLDPGGVAFPGLAQPALAGADGGLQVAWSENRFGGALPYDVFGARIGADLSLGANACVSLGAPAQRHADVALGAASALLVYRSESSGDAHVKAIPMDLRGNALLDEPLDLAGGLDGAPAVGFDGSRYLVAWGDAESGDVRALRLDESGGYLDSAPFTVLAGRDPALAGLVDQFLVCTASSGGVHAARVTGEGVVLDTPALELESGVSEHAAVGPLGAGQWLAAWEALGLQDGSEIRAALIFAGGIVAGPLPVTEEGDGIAPLRPVVAGGDTLLIAWQDDRDGDGNHDLHGRRMAAASLQFLPGSSGLALTDAPGSQTEPAAAWDGSRFVVDFLDDRARVNDLDHRFEAYRGWAPAGGSQIDEPAGLPLLDDSSATVLDPALAANTDGNTLYVASVFDAEAPHAAYRLRVRFSGESTAAEETPVFARRLDVYPNPANPTVQIRFSLDAPGAVDIDVFDLTGRRVARLNPGPRPAGVQELRWDGRSADGRELPTGIYLLRLRSAGQVQTAKLTLLR